jgi:nitrogen fixation protein
MCAALAYLLNNKVEEGWLMTLENVPQNDKLTLFIDCHYSAIYGEPEAEEGWLMILENFPQNEKLTLFIDY